MISRLLIDFTQNSLPHIPQVFLSQADKFINFNLMSLLLALQLPVALFLWLIAPKYRKLFNLLVTLIFPLFVYSNQECALFIFLLLSNYILILAMHHNFHPDSPQQPQLHNSSNFSPYIIVVYNLMLIFLKDLYYTNLELHSFSWTYLHIKIAQWILVQRLTYYSFYVKRHPERRSYLLQIHNFLFYILGFTGIITGPFLDVDNFEKMMTSRPLLQMDRQMISQRLKYISYYGLQSAFSLTLKLLFNFASNNLSGWPLRVEIATGFLAVQSFALSILTSFQITLMAYHMLDYSGWHTFLYPNGTFNNRQYKNCYNSFIKACIPMPLVAYDLRRLYLTTNFSQYKSEWNRGTVMWLQYLYSDIHNNMHRKIFMLLTSFLWHGVSIQYSISLLVVAIVSINNHMLNSVVFDILSTNNNKSPRNFPSDDGGDAINFLGGLVSILITFYAAYSVIIPKAPDDIITFYKNSPITYTIITSSIFLCAFHCCCIKKKSYSGRRIPINSECT